MTKTTAPVHTAGDWHMLNGLNGYPHAGTYPGTDLVFQSCWETTGDGTVVVGPQHGGIVTPATKHLNSVKAMMVAAAGAPWVAVLCDLQGYYRMSTTNVTGILSRTLINSNTFTASSSSGLLLTYTNDFNTFTKVRFTTTTTLPTGLALATDYWLVRVSATTARVATSLANAIAGTPAGANQRENQQITGGNRLSRIGSYNAASRIEMRTRTWRVQAPIAPATTSGAGM